MRQETTTRTLYTFEELSDKAKEKALAKGAEMEGEFFADSTDGVFADFERICAILGITLRKHAVKLMGGGTRWDPVIYYSGFWGQGDGASFEGTYEYAKRAHRKIRGYAPQDTVLHGIADGLLALQKKFAYGLTATMTVSGHYVHSGCMDVDVEHNGTGKWDDVALPEDELTEIMRDLANWLYKSLRDEYEYRTGAEQVKEMFEANKREFTEDGTLA